MSFVVTFFAYYLPFVYSDFTQKKYFLLQKMVGAGAPSSLVSTALYEDIILELEYYSGFIFKFLAPLNLNIFID